MFFPYQLDTTEYKLEKKTAAPAKRKLVARFILFLHSDFEYRWPLMQNWFYLNLSFLLLIVGLLFFLELRIWIWLPIALPAAIALQVFKYYWEKYLEKHTKGDKSIRPFFSKEEYEYALAHPVFLAGKN